MGLKLKADWSHFRFGTRTVNLQVPRVMGILNITSDSFSDGGELLHDGKPLIDRILQRAEAMLQAGASFLDIGGESTRPGATFVAEAEEADRVLPVVEILAGRLDVVISVDTSSPLIMQESARLGAGLINDVRALTRKGALEAAVKTGLPVCLMHMQGQPENMQQNPGYLDVVEDIEKFFRERISACEQAGLVRQKLILDPGFGFGKTFDNNLDLLDSLQRFSVLQLPLLVGLSRKRMLGVITGKDEKHRQAAGLAAAVIAAMKGASIIRTHDVDATVDAMRVCEHLMGRASSS